MAGDDRSAQENFLRSILTKESLDALIMLKSINKGKYEVAEKMIVSYYERTHAKIDLETYKALIGQIEREVNISYQRRTNSFDLDDIEE